MWGSPILLKDDVRLKFCKLGNSTVCQHIQVGVRRNAGFREEKRPNDPVMHDAAPNVYLITVSLVLYHSMWVLRTPDSDIVSVDFS